MGVYIKGMEMPKEGVYWCEIGVADDIAMITIHGEDRKSFPLISVPPHGRLIDADAMIRDIEKTIVPSRYIKERNADMVKFLSLEDTIIPAEEGETSMVDCRPYPRGPQCPL